MEKREYDRGVEVPYIKVWTGREERFIDKNKILQLTGTQTIIRIPGLIYPAQTIPPHTLLTHFGLYIDEGTDPAGSYALLARIVENGKYDGKNQILPLLSLSDPWIAYIVTCIESIPVPDIDPKYYRVTIGSIKDSATLKKAMINRYRGPNPTYTEFEISEMPVSIRVLKLVRVLSNLNLQEM